MTMDELRRIEVVPHFMRLHEWIALEEGLFADEGLEPEVLTDVMHSVSGHRGDEYGDRPQDRPFVQESEMANSACAWGSICNAGAGMGRFVPDLYGVGRYAIFARADSGIERLSELRDVPVGIGLMAGSHFTTLAALEQCVPRERINVVHTGGPGRRIAALLEGEVEVANLLDPEIPIAEARGLRRLAAGEFRTLFWVAPTLDAAVLGSYFRVLRRADEALRADPGRYMPLWENNVPPDLRSGDLDYATFGLGELLYFERYDDDMLEEALRFAERWGLRSHVKEDRYENLVASVSV
jgi:hypothetical protein